MNRNALEQISFAANWHATQLERGETLAKVLLALPTPAWRNRMSADAALRSYGVLCIIIENIHSDAESHPVLAYERVSVVLEYVDTVEVPHPIFRAFVQGGAWREYAYALRLIGRPREAIKASAIALRALAEFPSLRCETAKIEVDEAHARSDVADYEGALRLARSAAQIFHDHADTAGRTTAVISQACVLFRLQQFREAMSLLSETAREAEARGDRKTLAACLHNTAECARALGDEETAREMDGRAVALLNEVGNGIDAPRVRWAHALSSATAGRVNHAISELYKVRAEFLAMGMNSDAAVASLDVVRLQHDRGEDVTTICAELVRTFAEAGMTQHAIEALSYLREEARRGSLSPRKIAEVRKYLTESARVPGLLFVRPPEDSE